MDQLMNFMMNELLPYPIRAMFFVIILLCIMMIRHDVNILKGGK